MLGKSEIAPERDGRTREWVGRLIEILFFEEWKGSAREKTVFLLRKAGIALTAGILGQKRFFFGCRPFGVAFLSAGKKDAAAAAIGCAVSAALSRNWVGVIVSLAFGGLLWFWEKKKADGRAEIPAAAPTVLAAFFAVFLSMGELPATGVSIYALLSVTVCTTTAAAAGFLASRRDRRGLLTEIAVYGVWSGIFCYALTDFRLFSLRPAPGAAFILILLAVGHCRPATAIAVGLGCGFGCGTPTIPALVAASGAALLAKQMRVKNYGAIALLSSTLVTLYCEGFTGLTQTLPSLIAGGTLAIVAAKLKEKKGRETESAQAYRIDLPKEAETMLRNAVADETALAEEMRSLSAMLDELSKSDREPTREQIMELCDAELQCLGLDHGKSFLHSVGIGDLQCLITEVLLKNGRIEKADLPNWAAEECGKKLGAVLENCNRRYAALLRRLREDDRTGIFAAGYRSAAGILRQCAERKKETYLPNREKSRRAAAVAESLGLHFDGITVCGSEKLRLTVYGLPVQDLQFSAGKLQDAFGTECGCRFGAPDVTMENGYCVLRMESMPIMRFEVHTSRRKKEGESVCGDETCHFENADGRFCGMLSDGMGSGEKASRAARLCCHLTKHLAICGAAFEDIATGVGDLLLHQSEECAATVDMMAADACSGRVSFLKSGAVPSFILRDGRLFKISAATLPLGVTARAGAETVRTHLHVGDLAVLCSDGILPDADSEIWLCKLLSVNEGMPPALLADLIAEKAAERTGRSDDISVLLVQVLAA